MRSARLLTAEECEVFHRYRDHLEVCDDCERSLGFFLRHCTTGRVLLIELEEEINRNKLLTADNKP